MFSVDSCVLKIFCQLKLSDKNSVLFTLHQDDFDLGYSQVRVFTS